MATAPTNLLLAQSYTAADLSNLGRANSPGINGGPPPGSATPNGLQFQTREEAQMFLQAAGRAQQNGGNPNGIALTRDAVAALQHAAQVAAVNQAKMGPHGPGANGNMRPPVQVMQQLGQGQNPALANMHTQAQLQAAMNAQRAAQAAAHQNGGLSANNQAALFLVQNQLAQAQQAANNAAQVNAYGQLQNGLQNNPIAAAAAAAAAVAATTQAAQARAAAVGNANLQLQLQQAAQAAGLQRPQAVAWAQNQALQSAAIAQHNLAQQNLAAAQNNPALLAAALQAQQARANLQVQQLAQHQAAAAAAARPLAPNAQNNVAAAQQLQVLRQLQARLNAVQAPNGLAAAAGPGGAAPKPTEAQLQALRTALARSAAGRAALNAANVLGANPQRSAVPPAANGIGQGPALNPLQQAINLQLLLQQQRNAVQVQQAQAQVNAMASNLASMQNHAAASALNGQLAALQQAAAANAAANGQRPGMQGGAAAALAGLGGPGGINEVVLQNLQKMQLAKAMQEASAAAVSGMAMQQAADKAAPGGDAAASNSSKEQRRLALACVALQLARGGMTVEQAINSGIMGGMSVTDVKFIVECYNAERQRMQNEGTPGGGAAAAAAAAGHQQHLQQHQQQQQHGPQQGMQGLQGHMPSQLELSMHAAGLGMGGMLPNIGGHGHQHGMQGPNGMQQPLPFAPSPTPGSPAPGAEARDPTAAAAPSRMGLPVAGHSSAPVSPPRTASQGSPTQRGPFGASSDAEGAALEARSEGGASAELAADAAAAVAALAKEPFDAFSYAFFGATEEPSVGSGGLGELLGELELGADGGELEALGGGGALEAEPQGAAPPEAPAAAAALSGLGELDPAQAAWLRAAASANQAMWAGEGAEDGPMSNDEIAARLANLDLGSGFF
ncbi:hypothetical protein TSOC_001824 [Tetrabaena socialis]|uniref:Uncharacterized protein n=1 Tax=Tetrabaena socialis TaxID=47790 RepID=A0A2J8AFU2_9CHLO|nr:hypothetical protein TSOC_001824 [Tetrabaena socialis]|eukprot:PNH11394.1 hypothetical protein TSOC_001824 [Tetrabaena socialis]